MQQIPLEALPSISPFFIDYVGNWTRVDRFYAAFHSVDEIERLAREQLGAGSAAREDLASVLQAQQRIWGVDPAPAGRLARGAVAVITGQQAGLFTGPMYSVLKALTAVKIACVLKQRGIDAVPVFWIAAEDHDRREIEWAGIPGRDREFHRITARLEAGEGAPAGWMKFTARIPETVQECFRILPESEYRAEVFALLTEAYRPEASPVDAFARMMGRLFRSTELVFVDPLEAGFRKLSKEAMDSAFASADRVRAAALERSAQVQAAGYAAQVRVDDGFTGFFAYRGKSREPLGPGDTAPASSLSPNALLRPVIQDSVFPTAAFVAGPAEIAYFAQAAAVYDCLGIRMPPVFPRITATILDPPAARVMKKYGFGIEDVFEGPERMRRKAVGKTHDADAFMRTRGEVADSVERLRPMVEGLDPTLGGAMDNALRKIEYQVERLERRFVNAEVRRNQTLDRQLATVSNRLFPERKLQERAVNVTAFLMRYGLGFVPMLDRALELDGSVHQVVEL